MQLKAGFSAIACGRFALSTPTPVAREMDKIKLILSCIFLINCPQITTGSKFFQYYFKLEIYGKFFTD
jgi:hypothetical protein